MHYFKCTIPRSMQGFVIHEINVNFEPGDASRFYPCLSLQDEQEIDYWVFFRGELVPQQVLSDLRGKKIWISTEPLQREDIQRMYLGANKPFYLEHRKYFDFMTHYDFTEIPALKAAGFEVNSEFLLPVDIETYKPMKLEKKWDVVFMGRATPRRQMITGAIKKDFEFLSIDNGVYGEEAVRLYNMSKIGMNLHVGSFKQQQHRIFNMMACGLPIISDELTHCCWLPEAKERYIDFVKEADARKLYSLVIERLEDTVTPLEYRGKLMRGIAEKHFDARENWVKLIRKVNSEVFL